MSFRSVAAAMMAAIPVFCFFSGAADAAGYCRDYARVISVDGRLESGHGTACLRPDGVWSVVLNTGSGFQPRQSYSYFTADLGAPVYLGTAPVILHQVPVIVQQRPATTSIRIISRDRRYDTRHHHRHDVRQQRSHHYKSHHHGHRAHPRQHDRRR